MVVCVRVCVCVCVCARARPTVPGATRQEAADVYLEGLLRMQKGQVGRHADSAIICVRV
jgi:hypothetical protein